MRTSFMIVVFCWGILSCQKDNSLSADANKITLSDVLPVMDQQFRNGDTMKLATHLTTGSELHSISFFIINMQNDTLFSTYKHTHTTDVTVNYSWPISVAVAQQLKVKISVILSNGYSDSLSIPVYTTL